MQATTSEAFKIDKGALDPVSRTSEILFGLIMVLTFTCTLSATEAGREDIREMLIGALGCNIAWGIIDAFFYLMNVIAEKGRDRLLVKKLKEVTDQHKVQELFAEVIPESMVNSLSPQNFLEVRDHVLKFAEGKKATIIALSDLKAAFVVFVLVFLSTFPVTLPFLVMQEPLQAIRVSNLIALLLLFGLGYSLGRYAGLRPWRWGIGMTVVGVLLVALTIALGG